ncbi:MAG: DUF6611 family protein [Propionicimonas sp.]
MERRSTSSPRPGLWARLLDGERVWGEAEVTVPRGGVPRYCLVVYRPGIEASDRRLLRLWHRWPLYGGTGFFATALLVAFVLPAPWPLLTAIGWFLTGFGLLGYLTADERARVRRLSLFDDGDAAGLADAAALARLRCLGELLVAADADLASGRITQVEHALAWSTAYTELSRPGVGVRHASGRHLHRLP